MGTCNICDNSIKYQLSDDSGPHVYHLREQIICEKCGATSRDRMIMWSLSNCMQMEDMLFNLRENKNIRILESHGYRGYPKILDTKFDYFNTLFSTDPRLKNKKTRNYADFQDLHYNDNYFDFILASDVFEHVRLAERGFSEMYRVLKNDGYFIMTIPFDYFREKTKLRVSIGKEESDDKFIEPPEYHGGQTLVYRNFGRDIFESLCSTGLNVAYIKIQIPEFSISQQDIFICRKNSMPKIDFLDNKVSVFINESYPAHTKYSITHASKDYFKTMIEKFYRDYLFRNPDETGESYYLSILKNGSATIDDVKSFIFNSDEAKAIRNN